MSITRGGLSARRHRNEGRAIAVAMGVGIGMLIFQAQMVISGLTDEVFRNDFRLYVGAARLGLSRGFTHLYEFDLQRQAVEGLFPAAHYQPFVSPPVDAWLAIPLAGLPFSAGLWAWTTLLLASCLATWFLLAPGRGTERAAHLLLAAGFLPLGFAVSVGQLPPLIALGVASSYVLIRGGRPYLAGLTLLTVWLKPQDAILVAPALLLSGRWRPLVTWAAGTAVLLVVTLAVLGTHGLNDYRAALAMAGQWDLMRRFSLAGQRIWGPGGPVVSLVVATVSLAIARRQRGHLHLVMASALAGSLLVSPYLGLQDLSLLVPAIWLAWQEGIPRWHALVTSVLFVVAELCLLLGPVPLLAAEVTWLASIWVLGRPPEAGFSMPEFQNVRAARAAP